jgi:hypothetical protein
MELEIQKASLAREILNITDEGMISSMWLWLNNYNPNIFFQNISHKREIGILDGKTDIRFSDDFEMTTEELLELQ